MKQPDWFTRLASDAPQILPSLLQCDFANLRDETQQLEEAGIEILHLDVMDGVFVPNLTYGMPIVAALQRVTELVLDVHLMIERPDRYLQAFRDAGADVLTVHAEAVDDVSEIVDQIHATGALAGLAINPDTPLDVVRPAAKKCDVLLIMSVPAGFGGQSFHPVALEKLRAARTMVGSHCVLEVDGGINRETIRDCRDAGAEWFVVGSAIFGTSIYSEAITQLRDLVG